MSETRCFHCKLDVAPVDEDGCCNCCGADLGCTCDCETDAGTHTDECLLSVRESRDHLAADLARVTAERDTERALFENAIRLKDQTAAQRDDAERQRDDARKRADSAESDLACERERVTVLETALRIGRQMANAVYNASQNDRLWPDAQRALTELLPQFDAALSPPPGDAKVKP